MGSPVIAAAPRTRAALHVHLAGRTAATRVIVVVTPVAALGLLAVTHAGICGTDRHIYEWDAWSKSRVAVGITTGHEFVGKVVQLGSAVTRAQKRASPTAGQWPWPPRRCAASPSDARCSIPRTAT